MAVVLEHRHRPAVARAGRLLRRVVDFALVEGDGRLDRALADRALTRLGVPSCALTSMTRTGSSVSVDRIVSVCGR